MVSTLFPLNLPARDWAEFRAEGFSNPVWGAIHLGSNPPECGLPLGSIDSGCLDLEVNGVLGYSSIFNALVPRRGPLHLPFLGISVGLQSWVCTMLNMQGRKDITWFDIYHNRFFRGVNTAEEIHYWGHYPVADVEFGLAGSPVGVGLRAWSPFIPGDVAASNTPGAIFEVHLRNLTEAPQKGAMAFSFPGPSEAEAGTVSFERVELTGPVTGLSVKSEQASYVLGVIGEPAARRGGALSADGTDWAIIEHYLPPASHQAGSSLAVDFALEANEEKVVRFILAWHSPVWRGGGTMTGGGNAYTHMYASRYADAEAAAHYLAENHESLLKRILAWQSVLYREESLPGWLRDALVNVLHLITETSVWGQAKAPIGDWCRPEDGLFGMNESPRYCPQIECIPCSYYGNLPLVYFFPGLALSTLRGYKAYQYPSGQAPWVFGGCTVGSPPYELAMPSPGYANKPQATLDGACYAEMVDKLWLRSGDDAVLKEFYESVKRNMIFTLQLNSRGDAPAIVSMPDGNNAYDWYELCDLFGVVPHIGGVHLAQLRTVKRMAEAMGDADFARQCQDWLDQGSAALEEYGWEGRYYLLFNELETGKKSRVVLAHQLDGEWMARFHGLPGVFRPDRVATTLETLKRTSLAKTEHGAAVFSLPEDDSGDGWDPGYWAMRGAHPPGTFVLAMQYIYSGQKGFGIDLARRMVKDILRRGWIWDWAVVVDGSIPRVGFDYYQNLMLWSLPAVIQGGDLRASCEPGALVDRILRAGNPVKV